RPLRAAGHEVDTPEIRYSSVSPGFFATLGIPLVRGREFTAVELNNNLPVLVASEAAARHLWPGEDAVGKTLAVSETAFAARDRPAVPGAFRNCDVIGVARDVTYRVGDPDRAQLYFSGVGKLAGAPLYVR